jgi:L-rhamnose mutarotase
VQRFGQVIRLQDDAVARYKELHASVRPEVLGMISACHLTNYTIFLREPENLLFAYFEYVGEDYAADMARMAADPVTQKWWAIAMPLQDPLPTRAEGDWWAATDEVFHLD